MISFDLSLFFIILSFGFSIWAAGHALLTKEHSRAAFSWIVVCWLMPYIGPLLYFWFGNDRVRKRAEKLTQQSPDLLHTFQSRSIDASDSVDNPYLKNLAQIGKQVSDFNIEDHNCLQPIYSGDAVYQRMLKAINEARHTVYLASYIFNYDEIGRKFVDALEAAHLRGVKVYVLVDGVGEWYSFKAITRQLKRRGIFTARFYPPKLIPPSLYINIRNHRKILVVDQLVGFVGGMNIYRKHSEACSNESSATRDTHFEVTGPIVAQLARVFEDDWSKASRQLIENQPMIEVSNAPGQLCRTVIDGPDERLDSLLFLLLSAINSAQQQLMIVTPYFIYHESLIRAMETATLRGVEINIVLPERSNLRPVDWASRHIWGMLLHRGIRLFLQPAPFDHSKLLVVDRSYALIGSANLDPRSIRLNYEIVVEVYDEPFAQDMASHIDSLIAESSQYKEQQWSERSGLVKLRDGVCWLFSPYL